MEVTAGKKNKKATILNELTDMYVLFWTATSTLAEKLSLRSSTASAEVPLKNFTYACIISETVFFTASIKDYNTGYIELIYRNRGQTRKFIKFSLWNFKDIYNYVPSN